MNVNRCNDCSPSTVWMSEDAPTECPRCGGTDNITSTQE